MPVDPVSSWPLRPVHRQTIVVPSQTLDFHPRQQLTHLPTLPVTPFCACPDTSLFFVALVASLCFGRSWLSIALFALRTTASTSPVVNQVFNMSGSSVGSDIFFAIALLLICLLVLLLLRYYLPLRTTPAFISVPVFLAIALPASIILLVPIDLASSAGTDTSGSRGIWLPAKALTKLWRVLYWLTFALTWSVQLAIDVEGALKMTNILVGSCWVF